MNGKPEVGVQTQTDAPAAVHCHCRAPKKYLGIDMGYFYIVPLKEESSIPGLWLGRCPNCNRFWELKSS